VAATVLARLGALMGAYVTPYFSRDGNAAAWVIGFIDRCTDAIDAAVYSVTHDGIADALIRAHQRGVKVRLLTDKVQAGSHYADDERLEAAGVAVRRDRITGSMHHKFMVGDGKDGGRAVATGSFNWTASADTRNMENFVVLRLSYVAVAFQAEFDALWELNAPEAA
jgi:phosphatidylserine/phosphatidylglycerophosphate/cardiolipin synthase-like enzyme